MSFQPDLSMNPSMIGRPNIKMIPKNEWYASYSNGPFTAPTDFGLIQRPSSSTTITTGVTNTPEILAIHSQVENRDQLLRSGTVKGTAGLTGLGTGPLVSSMELEVSKKMLGNNNTGNQLLRNTAVKGTARLAKLQGGPLASSIELEVSKKIADNTGTIVYAGAGRVNGTNMYKAGLKMDGS